VIQMGMAFKGLSAEWTDHIGETEILEPEEVARSDSERKEWLTGARGKTLVREAELDRAENSRSGGSSHEEASGGSARIEVWQDFLHASEVGT
ncbi:hypothetical protein Taro_050342, partial [Colocasia esculenta]|nr:hypothetical protein [Colocasia esculenta]